MFLFLGYFWTCIKVQYLLFANVGGALLLSFSNVGAGIHRGVIFMTSFSEKYPLYQYHYFSSKYGVNKDNCGKRVKE